MHTESKQIKNNRNTKIFMDSLATDTKNDLFVTQFLISTRTLTPRHT